MFYLEEIRGIFVDVPEDKKYLRMVFKDACRQCKVEEDAIQLHFEHIDFLGLFGSRVVFKISGYTSGEKATKVIKRVYKRLYNSRGTSHRLWALTPTEKVPFDILITQSDKHKLESLNLNKK